MKLHAVGAIDDSSKLMTRNTSCYCNICIEGAYCDSWKTQQFIWSGIVLPIHDHQMEQEEAEATEFERIEDTDPEQKVKVGDFVAVVYDAKWFIGKIEEIDREENDCEVNFLTNAKHMF